MDFFSNYNVSILSIPVYHFLTLFPHAYAIGIGKKAFPNGRWDNRNPRGNNQKAALSKLDKESFSTFERAEACSTNGFENFPVFAAAVVLGNIAGLDKGVMDRFALSILTVRLTYTVCYLNSSSNVWASMRTLSFVAHTALCWRLFISAASAMMRK